MICYKLRILYPEVKHISTHIQTSSAIESFLMLRAQHPRRPAQGEHHSLRCRQMSTLSSKAAGQQTSRTGKTYACLTSTCCCERSSDTTPLMGRWVGLSSLSICLRHLNLLCCPPHQVRRVLGSCRGDADSWYAVQGWRWQALLTGTFAQGDPERPCNLRKPLRV